MARILAVDDDDLIRRALVRILEAEGHEVESASNGQDAWEMQSETPFDLILTDLFMPDVDGIEFLTRMSEVESETRIVAISGGGRVVGDTGALEDAEAFGARATLRKPFTPDDVTEVVKQVLAED